jgi:hypothetical protein
MWEFHSSLAHCCQYSLQTHPSRAPQHSCSSFPANVFSGNLVHFTCSPAAHWRLRSGASRAGIGYTAATSAERNGATRRGCAAESYWRIDGGRAERPNLSLAILPKNDLARHQQ